MFHKNKLGSIIRSNGTVFYSLLYLNSRQGFKGLKYVYLVVPVIDNSLLAMLKSRELLRSCGQSAISTFLGGTYLHAYIQNPTNPTNPTTQPYKPYPTIKTYPTNPTQPSPTALQALSYPTHTNNTHMCNENKKRIWLY